MKPIVGIDLGTTNSCAAIFRRGRAEVIPSSERSRTTPSVVSYEDDGNRTKIEAGLTAKMQAHTNPAFTFSSLKRIIGRPFDDPHVQRQAETATYRIEEGPDGQAWVLTREGLKSPAEVLSYVFAKLRAAATNYTGEVVDTCVLTRPAHFDTKQTAAMRDAARMGGFDVRCLEREPTAAAIYYGLERGEDKTIAVYDFGGGTFDVSILRVRGRSFKTLSADGDSFLGGEDFDFRIVEHVAEQFAKLHGIELRHNPFAQQRLKDEAERAKIHLSAMTRYELNIGSVSVDAATNRAVNLTQGMERVELETLCRDLIERTVEPCERALRAARLKPSDIDDVLLVGGMTAMPAIQMLVAEIFGRPPRFDVQPDEVVAQGAAMRGATLRGDIKGASYGGDVEHSLGLELASGDMLVLLKAGTPLPARKTARILMADPDQTTVAVRIYESDSAAAKDGRLLGTLIFRDVPPSAPDAQADFEVEFDYGADGVLAYRAKDIAHGQELSERVHVLTGLSGDDIEDAQNTSDEQET